MNSKRQNLTFIAMKTLLLDDGTVGTLDYDDIGVGDFATVKLHDENGNEIEVCGVVVEILD